PLSKRGRDATEPLRLLADCWTGQDQVDVLEAGWQRLDFRPAAEFDGRLRLQGAPGQYFAGCFGAGVYDPGSMRWFSQDSAVVTRRLMVQLLNASRLSILAGAPPASTPGGMSCVTTLPAATTELRPIVTPLRTVTRAPSHTPCSSTTGSDVPCPP